MEWNHLLNSRRISYLVLLVIKSYEKVGRESSICGIKGSLFSVVYFSKSN